MQKSLADLTNEELNEITNLAALFFTPREIAIMLDVDPNEFTMAIPITDRPIVNFPDKYQAIYAAYQKGRLQAEVDLRTSILKLAKSGSSPAQTMAMDLLKQSKIKILDR